MKINHLDLFSGIGGFHKGFQQAGYKVNSYFSEIDKHAIAVYKNQFKDAEYVGSVVNLKGDELPRINLVTFGSPCQDFSLAGKRKGMSGDRSSLVLEAIRLISECRPGVFIWENVKGTFSSNSGEDFAAILQAFTNIGGYRLEWQLLNTSWFLPQNRERIYLVGYSTTTKRNWRGVFPIGESSRKSNELEGQQGIANCLHTKYQNLGNGAYIGERKLKKDIEVGDFRNDEGWRPRKDGLAPCLATRRSSEQDVSTMPPILKVKSAVVQPNYDIVKPFGQGSDDTFIQSPYLGITDKRGNQKSMEKASTLCAGYSKAPSDGDYIKVKSASTDPRGYIQPNYEIVKQKVWVRKHEVDIEGLQDLLRSHKNKTNKEIAEALNQPITKVEHWFRKDRAGFSIPEAELWNDLKTLLGISSKEYDAQVTEFVEQDGKYDQAERVYNTQALAPTLTLAQEVKIKDNAAYRIRRLTPIECERLQGFPDNHTEYGNYDGQVKKMSNTQRYKQCGNAVTVDVVQAIAEKIKPLFK